MPCSNYKRYFHPRLWKPFRQKFHISLQMLTGNAADYTTLPKQTTLLTNQAAAALKDMKEADEHEKSEQLVKKIMELVKKDKTITREALAGQVYLSPDYMAKIFKKETGKKISDYLQLFLFFQDVQV